MQIRHYCLIDFNMYIGLHFSNTDLNYLFVILMRSVSCSLVPWFLIRHISCYYTYFMVLFLSVNNILANTCKYVLVEWMKVVRFEYILCVIVLFDTLLSPSRAVILYNLLLWSIKTSSDIKFIWFDCHITFHLHD